MLRAEPADGKTFENAVRRAITNLCDPTKLAVSPLLQLAGVGAALHDHVLDTTPLQRVAVLKVVLSDLVVGPRPQGRTQGYPAAAFRFYNLL